MEEEVAHLRLLLYPESDAIPESAWNVFPESGSYIKNIMIYGGYSTRKSLNTLQKKEELEALFNFIREMADDMTEEERRDLLGVFNRNPQKLRIIPGCVAILEKFIEDNKSKSKEGENFLLGSLSTSNSSSSGRTNSKMNVTLLNTSAGEIDDSVTEESVSDQLKEWWDSILKEDGMLAEKLVNCKKDSFADTFSMKWTGDDRKCICEICEVPLVLPKKYKKDSVVLSISNVTKHMKNCWLKADFQLPRTNGKRQSSLKEFFRQPPPIITGIDFTTDRVNPDNLPAAAANNVANIIPSNYINNVCNNTAVGKDEVANVFTASTSNNDGTVPAGVDDKVANADPGDQRNNFGNISASFNDEVTNVFTAKPLSTTKLPMYSQQVAARKIMKS